MNRYYIKLHLDYLHEIELGLKKDDLFSYPSLYEHMHAFFLTLGLSEDEAGSIINDFRQIKC